MIAVTEGRSKQSQHRRLARSAVAGAVLLLPAAIFFLDIPPGALAGCGTYGYACTQTACFRVEISTNQGYTWQAGSAWVYGPQGTSIDLYVRTTMSSTVNSIEGWSMGLKHTAPTLIGIQGGNLVLKAASAATGSNTVSTVQAGGVPDFLNTRVWSCGQTQGVAIDYDATHRTTGPNSSLVTTLSCYRLTFPYNSSTHQVTLDFTDDVGLPAVKNLVVRSGQSIVPCKDKLTINVLPTTSYSPTQSYCPYSQMQATTCDPPGGGGGGVEPAVECHLVRPFLRGDANSDGGVDIADVVKILLHLFNLTQGSAITCLDAADTDDTSGLEITDAIYLLRFLFVASTPPPPAPHGACGLDLTADGLGCSANAACPGIPATLTLHSPANNSSGVSQDVQLVCRRLWPGNEAVVYPVLYEFQVSTSPTFATLTATSDPQEWTTFFPYNIDAKLPGQNQPDITYYWRVIATDSSEPSPEIYESDTWSFSMRTAKTIFASPTGGGNFDANDLEHCGCPDHADPSLDCSLEEANRALPGSIVFLKSGTYNRQIQPQNNGTSEMPIRYQPYEGPNSGGTGDVVLTPNPPGLSEADRGFRLSFGNNPNPQVQRSYCTIDGRFRIVNPNTGERKRRIIFANTQRHWGDVDGSHNVVRNCEFKPYASGNTVGDGINFYTANSDYNLILNNTFDKGCMCVGSGGTQAIEDDCGEGEAGNGDAIHLSGGSFNIIQGNIFHNIGHAGIEFSKNTNAQGVSPIFGARNVIRGNTFFEVHNAFGVTGEFNLIEYNTAYNAGCGHQGGAGCYAKVDGLYNIVRQNVFVDDDLLDCVDVDPGMDPEDPSDDECPPSHPEMGPCPPPSGPTKCIRRTYEEDMINIGLERAYFNRFYNNLVYGGTSGPGLHMKQDQNHRFPNLPTETVPDVQSVRDNAFLNNTFAGSCSGVAGYLQDGCKSNPTQVFHGFQSGEPTGAVYNRFRGNLVWGIANDDRTVFYRICLTANGNSLSTGLPLSDAIAAEFCDFSEGLVFDETNVEENPEEVFVECKGPAFEGRDFCLVETAASLIDRGQPLAVIQSMEGGGSKLNLVPEESSQNGDIPTSTYFFDGGFDASGIPLGDTGDLIRIVHQIVSASDAPEIPRFEHYLTRVTKVNAVLNGLSQLEVEPAVPQVGAGDTVHLYFFNGCAPDVGRYESPH